MFVNVKSYCINGNLSKLFNNYLQKPKVAIQDSRSDLILVHAGVPPGSVFGPLLFLEYIKDITEVIESNMQNFAYDTTLYLNLDDHIPTATVIDDDLINISNWAEAWQDHPFHTKIIPSTKPALQIKATYKAQVEHN